MIKKKFRIVVLCCSVLLALMMVMSVVVSAWGVSKIWYAEDNTTVITEGEDKIDYLFRNFSRTYNTSIQDLTVYDVNNLSMILPIRNTPEMVGVASSEIGPLIKSYNNAWPIERIEHIDGNNIMVIYRFNDIDESLAYYFCVLFKRKVDYHDSKDAPNGDVGFYESWKATSEYYYVYDDYSFDDFETVTVRTDANTVIGIDPTVRIEHNRHRVYKISSNQWTFYSYRILSDGIMVITFATDEDYGEDISSYTVRNIEFYEYGSSNFPNEISIRKDCDFWD